jgi:hypothetical protein
MTDKPIHYEPHPVSPARKKELIASGVRIVDIKHRPRGMVAAPVAADIPLTPTGVVLTEADAQADLIGEPRPDNPGRSSWAENMSNDELRAALTERGVHFRSNASRATLLALME